MSAGPVARPAHGAGGKASGNIGRYERLSNRNGASAADGSDAGEGERLSKRVAQLLGCSRREAEQTIEGGWVRVDGQVVEIPQHRVQAQTVTVDPDASLLGLAEVTLILHKPPNVLDSVQDAADPESAAAGASQSQGQGQAQGRTSNSNSNSNSHAQASGVRRPPSRGPSVPTAHALLIATNHSAQDTSGQRPLLRHFKQLQASVPLETAASGLLVFTQDWRVQRKLMEDMAQMEHELMVEVRGEVKADALIPIERALRDPRQRLPVAKISISSASTERSILRLAVKGAHPGLAAYLCELAGLEIQALRRIRLGRVSMGDVAPGQWRYLAEFERF